MRPISLLCCVPLTAVVLSGRDYNHYPCTIVFFFVLKRSIRHKA